MAIDSKYAYAGLQGAAYRWRDNGWVSASGPVSNVDLWPQLLEAIQSFGTIFQWVKIPCHVGLHGNDAADELANRGRLMSPLYPPPPPPPPPLSVGPNFSHHKARVQAVGWFPLGIRKQGSRPFAAPTPPTEMGPDRKQPPPPPLSMLSCSI